MIMRVVIQKDGPLAGNIDMAGDNNVDSINELLSGTTDMPQSF